MTYEINDINDINLEIIIDYCKEHGQIAWLKAEIEREVPPDKNGRPRKLSFIELRKAFAIKFMPQFAPKYESKRRKSMYELIADLTD